ncbi:MAG: SDR family NAD(P)-dependent oxidoreductase [Myxococcota bacterium]
MKPTHRTTLITGANSGLGLEAARQLLARRNERVIITARSQAKADRAIAELLRRTRAEPDRIDSVLADYMVPETVSRALSDLKQKGVTLDAIVLNAGGVAKQEGGTYPRTPSGLTSMFAMNVSGHAQLVHGLLDAGRVADGATIVFAASEVTRGIPAMNAAAAKLPEGPGSLEERIAAAARGDHLTGKADPFDEYGLAKLIGTAWMQHLAKTHGNRIRAFAISPGASAGTSGANNMPFLMGLMMKYVMFPTFRLMGRAHGVEAGAARYVKGLDDQSLVNGGYYASPFPHMSGTLVLQDPAHQPLLSNDAFVAAVGNYLESLVARLQSSEARVAS